ncbi:hypothetical protein MPDQ_002673, partial [Monascus purpureus]
LQNDFNIAKKGKKKLSATSKAKNPGNLVPPEVETAGEAPTGLNHRGRPICLPQCFRE